jgi:hypothetical protein
LIIGPYQQGQQLSQDYGALFHSNAYHSQVGSPPEPHQSLSDLSFSSSRGPVPKVAELLMVIGYHLINYPTLSEQLLMGFCSSFFVASEKVAN